MKFVIAALALISLSLTVSGYSPPRIHADVDVFICVSGNSKAYHKIRECHGLNACTHTIKKVTEKEAINDYNRRACKVCYK